MKFPNIGIVGGLADGCAADMLADGAEIAAEPDVVVKADLLVAKEYLLVLNERLVQLLDLIVRQRPGQIDFADLRADVRRQRLDSNGFVAHTFLRIAASIDLRDGGAPDDLAPARHVIVHEFTKFFRA